MEIFISLYLIYWCVLGTALFVFLLSDLAGIGIIDFEYAKKHASLKFEMPDKSS